jgi:hypothetical protein
MHREGYVVEFLAGSSSWVGNFQPGMTKLSTVVPDPDSNLIMVIAGGSVYIVDRTSGQLARQFGGGITLYLEVPSLRAALISNHLWFELIRGEATIWRTKRLSWDGMRKIRLDGGVINGEAWRYDQSWHPFTVDVATGATTGGAYREPK